MDGKGIIDEWKLKVWMNGAPDPRKWLYLIDAIDAALTAEREACAKIAEDIYLCKQIAAAIRARPL